MRKSAAPSSKSSSSGQPRKQIVSWPKTTPINKPKLEAPSIKDEILPKPEPLSSNTPTGAPRSIASLLALLSDTASKENGSQEAVSLANVVEKENVHTQQQEVKRPVEVENNISEGEECGKKIFTVVWGKPTTKKHKTWEGDGTLEVEDTSAILKDETGKVLGRTTKIKPSELEEGKRMKIGSKEVELIEVLSTTPAVKRPLEEVAPQKNNWKKAKLGSSSLGGLTRKINPGTSPLRMPTPSSNHQWQFNTDKLPVVPVIVDGFLSNVLRQHQRIGVSFLYECVTGLRNPDQRGAILADEMGLGKTLQCITLIWTVLKQGPFGGRPTARRILIVCPSSLVKNWENEFDRWLGKCRLQIFAVDQKNRPSEFVRRSHIPVMVVSYEMLIRQIEEIRKIKFDLLVCDEGHRLKNSNVRASLLLSELEIKARVILSGTPIQNDLQEFFALIDFVNPGSLGSHSDFRQYFEEPIVAMQQPDATDDVISVGKKRAAELNAETKGFILRRTQAVIDKYLPKKTETVLFIKPSNLQSSMYYSALSWWADHESLSGTGENGVHFAVMMTLRKLCNHPAIAVSQSAKSDSDGGLVEQSGLVSLLQAQYERLAGSAKGTLPDQSGKLQVIRGIVLAVTQMGEKIVLVSYFTQMLDLLRLLCQELGLTFCRLDGSTPASQRMTIINKFNSRHGQSVFLLSARAGGVGLNLTGASRLVLVDSDWNPANDLQAMSRVWRDGQCKDVYIYRLLTCGTIEEKVFQRQISKSGLSGSIVDPNSTGVVRLSKAELKDLFTPNIGSRSLTHDSLECPCRGSGIIPDGSRAEEEEKELRDCQITLGSEKKTSSSKLSMNQLMLWQHHSSPFNSDLLKELALTSVAENFVFIFSNPSAPTISQTVDLVM